MRSLFLVAACVMAILLFCAPVQADSLTLQQGLNGYSGCQDSFVNTGGYSEDAAGVNYGLNQFLLLNCEHFENF